MVKAQQLFDEVFHNPKQPTRNRSKEYQRGFLDALRYRTGEGQTPNYYERYKEGTTERDAWEAGVFAGFQRWQYVMGRVK